MLVRVFSDPRRISLTCAFIVKWSNEQPVMLRKKRKEKPHQIYKHAVLLTILHNLQIFDVVIVHNDKRRCLKIIQPHICCEKCEFVIKLLMNVFFSLKFITAILSLLLHHSCICMCAVCVLFLSSPCPVFFFLFSSFIFLTVKLNQMAIVSIEG